MMPQQITSSGKRGTHVMPLSDSVGLVFGLDWMPLVGGEPTKLGRKRARSLRATHYLITGGLAAVVGCGIVHKEKLGISYAHAARNRPLHAAAAIFASAHQEGVIAAISFIPAMGYWFVAANSGLVLAQTDRWFESMDEADAALLVLKERFPNLQVLRYALLDTSNQPDWMRANIMTQTRLQRMPARGHLSLMLASFGILTTVFFIRFWFHDNASDPEMLPQESASELWQRVHERFAHEHPVHRPEQLFKVVQAWHQAPLSPGGWKLKQIACEPSSLDWHRVARYQRSHRLALSQYLDTAKPEGWTIEFPDLDHGMMRWKVLNAASLFELTSPSASLKDWLSYLQSVTPVFESIQIGTGTQITIPAPLNRQGMALQKPSHIKPINRRMISIKGPLRSLSALRGLSVPVRWRSLQLEIGAETGKAINRSALTISLTGDVFEHVE
jgi:hypothetical protein